MNARERLVAARQDSVEFLAAQLAKADKIETTLQGAHDVRDFLGVSADLRAAFDPAGGALNQLDQERLTLGREAELWKLRQTELKARHDYLAALDKMNGGDDPGAAPETGDPSAPTTPTLPERKPLFTLADAQTLAPKDAETTRAKAGLLDLLHDKLAFRDAVGAELRKAQLDDSHDLAGSTLYDLSFDITLIPGSCSQALAQVDLRLAPPAGDDAAERRLHRLFEPWMAELERTLTDEVRALNARLGERTLTEIDAQWLLTNLDRSFADEAAKLTATLLPTATPLDSARVMRHVALLSRAMLQDPAPILEARASNPDSREPTPPATAPELAPASVWLKYRAALRGIVDIEIVSAADPTRTTLRVAPSSDGRRQFVGRLRDHEQHCAVMNVTPKELAQNISQVAATRRVTNLALALQAMLPLQGVNAEAQAQRLHKRDELVHALARQPLVVGFAQGQGRFGWLLGPEFALSDDEASFLHRPIRHDVSASVVVPGWLDEVLVQGSYAWIDGHGVALQRSPLWDGKPLSVRVPTENSRFELITKALAAHPDAGGPSEIATPTRPNPRIEAPRGDAPAKLRSDQPQTLLIRGRELWRSPQVFVGNQKATRVEILSDMRGLLAHFDKITFPSPEGTDPVVVDLQVVTTYGTALEGGGVQLLAPPRKPAAEAPAKTATLRTRFVDTPSTRVEFAFKRPASYGALIVVLRPAQAPGTEVRLSAPAWNATEDLVSFDFPVSLRPDVTARPVLLDVDLRLLPTPDSHPGSSVLMAAPVRLAVYQSPAQRALRQLAGHEIAFVGDRPTTNAIEVLCLADHVDAFLVAHGLVKVPATAKLGFEGTTYALDGVVQPTADGIVIRVPGDRLTAERDNLIRELTTARKVRVRVADAAGKTVTANVLRAGSDDAAQVKVTKTN